MLRISYLLLLGDLTLPALATTRSAVTVINDNSYVVGQIDADKRAASRVLLTWDFSKQWQHNWSFAGNLKAFRGSNGEQLTANRQGISNIDAEHFAKIYEMYLQYQADDVSRVKCGQLDANLEFAMVPIGATFISPPLGITPTAVALPTYYDPALSCSYFYEPEQGLQWAGGVFAGRSQHNFAEQFYVAEGRYVSAHGRTSWGYWHHNGDWPSLLTERLQPATGWYLNHQQECAAGSYWFFVWSGLRDQIDMLHQHRMAGLVFGQWVADQEFGLVLSQVTAVDKQDEWMLESYWLWQLHSQFQLQPVLQWIRPAQPDNSDSLVITLRVLASF